MPIANRLFIFICFYPLCWLILFYGFALRAFILLGHCPIPSLNDPKDLGFDFHLFLVVLGEIGLILIILLWVFFNLFLKMHSKKDRFYLFCNLIFILGICLFFTLAKIDPAQLFEWLAD